MLYFSVFSDLLRILASFFAVVDWRSAHLSRAAFKLSALKWALGPRSHYSSFDIFKRTLLPTLKRHASTITVILTIWKLPANFIRAMVQSSLSSDSLLFWAKPPTNAHNYVIDISKVGQGKNFILESWLFSAIVFKIFDQQRWQKTEKLANPWGC